MGEGLLEDHLTWHNLLWLFELERKVLSSILELEYFFKCQYINQSSFQKSTACHCRLTSNSGQNNRSFPCRQGSSHPDITHHSTRQCGWKTPQQMILQSQLLPPNRKKLKDCKLWSADASLGWHLIPAENPACCLSRRKGRSVPGPVLLVHHCSLASVLSSSHSPL